MKVLSNIDFGTLTGVGAYDLKYQGGRWTPTHIFISLDPRKDSTRFYEYKSFLTELEYDILIINANLDELRGAGILRYKSENLQLLGEWSG